MEKLELDLFQKMILRNSMEDRIRILKRKSLFDKGNIDIKDEIKELNHLLELLDCNTWTVKVENEY